MIRDKFSLCFNTAVDFIEIPPNGALGIHYSAISVKPLLNDRLYISCKFSTLALIATNN